MISLGLHIRQEIIEHCLKANVFRVIKLKKTFLYILVLKKIKFVSLKESNSDLFSIYALVLLLITYLSSVSKPLGAEPRRFPPVHRFC